MKGNENPITKFLSKLFAIAIVAALVMGALGLFVKVTEWTANNIRQAIFKESIDDRR